MRGILLLQCPHLRVSTAARQQLVVRATLDDAAGIHDKDLVRVHHGRQPVSDDERGTPFRYLLEFRLDRLLGGRIERRSRLIENQDARILEDRARDRHALLLAARELQAALADAGLVTLRQGFDEFVDVRGLRRSDHFVARGLRAAIRNVVVNRVVEQHCVLRHDADRSAQGRLFDFANIRFVNQYAPVADVVEAIQQARECGFPRPAVPDHRHLVPGGDFEAHTEQDLAVGVVAEIDSVKTHRGLRAREVARVGPVLDFTVLGEEPKHAVEVDLRLLDLAVHHAEEIKRDVELDQQPVDEHEVTQRQLLGDHALRGENH